MISGHLREKRGYYHLILNYIDLDNNKKSISKATGLKTVGNKKRAELMLKDAKNKLEDSINQEIEKRRIQEEQAALLKIPYFTDFLIDWLSIIKSSVETSTYVAYESIIMRRVIPYFEPMKLKLTQISPLDIQTYYRYSLEVEKVSANTVIHRHANIRKALQYALKMDLIDKNPADRVERPKKDSFHPEIYNEDEIKQLLDAVKGDRIEFAVILGVFYGLRRSEIAGLKWKAIDFDNKTITISHTVIELYSNGKTIITEKDRTKTKSSYRTLPLVEPFEQLLFQMKQEQQYYKKMCGKSYQLKDQDYIYVDELGNRIQPNYITQHFSLILKKFHLKKIRFHDLRHSCASLLYSNGVNLKEIQEWLGHSDIATTSNIYTHLDYASKVKSANSILPILGEEKIS